MLPSGQAAAPALQRAPALLCQFTQGWLQVDSKDKLDSIFNISAQVFWLDLPLTVLQYSKFLALIVCLLLAMLNEQNPFSIIMQIFLASCAVKIELLACSSFTPSFPFLPHLPFSSIPFLLVSLLSSSYCSPTGPQLKLMEQKLQEFYSTGNLDPISEWTLPITDLDTLLKLRRTHFIRSTFLGRLTSD